MTCPSVFQRRNIHPKKSTEKKKKSEQVLLNYFRWVPDVCHRGEFKSSRELFEKVCVNAVFFGNFWDFGWVFGPLFLSLFCPCFCFPFWDFPDFSGTFPDFWGILRICPSPLSRPTKWIEALARNSPERVRDTFGTFPGKSGKPPGLETPPGLASLKRCFDSVALKVHANMQRV